MDKTLRDADVLRVADVEKTFTLHNQGGRVLPVIQGLTFNLAPGQCLALRGPSGAGKSSVLRMIYGNYRTPKGHIQVRHGQGGDGNGAAASWVDVARATPQEILMLRRDTIGYVSQFLRVLPRVATLDLVKDPLLRLGRGDGAAEERAVSLLSRLNIPDRLWSLSPVTFSGGEQQRVNLARGFAHAYPLFLLDEPTAALDAANRRVVVELIQEAKAAGSAVVGIFHDTEVRDAVSDRGLDIEDYQWSGAAA